MSSHPSIERVQAALAEHGLRPEITWFDDAVTTAQLAADALGVGVGQIANSLIFTLDDEPILILTSGAHRVDTSWLGGCGTPQVRLPHHLHRPGPHHRRHPHRRRASRRRLTTPERVAAYSPS